MKKISLGIFLLAFLLFVFLLIKCYKIDNSEVFIEYQNNIDVEKKENINNDDSLLYSNVTFINENNNIDEKIEIITKNIRLLVTNVTNKKCELTIIDNNYEFIVNWNYKYELELFKENEWIPVKKNHENKNMESFSLEKTNNYTFEINWQDEYEKLDKGIYRMKKVVYDSNMNEITIYSNIFEI